MRSSATALGCKAANGRSGGPGLKRLLVIIFLVAACGSTTPSPSGSPRAAATPAGPAASDTAPQPSASAGPAFVGEFPPIEIKGKGNKDVTFEIPEDSIAIASLSHPAKGAFNVGAYDEDGKLTQQIVKVNGKYAGTVLFDLETHSVAFKVLAKGPWKITIKPAEAAKAWDATKATKGKGDQVLRLTTPSAADANLQLQATGAVPFLVRAHSPDDDVDVAAGTGPAKLTKKLPEGTDLLEIIGRGGWQLALGS